MSKIALAGAVSGTATFTIESPATSTNRTLILPDNTGTIITQNSTPAFASTIGVGGATAAASGAGITFPATQSASSDANTLDDYEEGTWTPVITGAGYTASAASGTYTKVGRMVNLTCTFTFSAVPASNSACTFSGLPFSVVANVAVAGVFRDDSTTGALYCFRASGSTGEINSMDGVVSGSQRTIRTSEGYIGFVVYPTT
jgi:hypothetical protein